MKSFTFMFNDVYYKQVDRVAMVSFWGTTLANLFLVYYESKWLLLRMFLQCFKWKTMLRKFLDPLTLAIIVLNAPVKKEKTKKISLLDISISRNNNAMETSIFHKATFSGIYINFNNFLPTEYKIGLLHTSLYKTNHICSSYIQSHEDMRLEHGDFNGQWIGGKMKIWLEKPALNNFKPYRWQK